MGNQWSEEEKIIKTKEIFLDQKKNKLTLHITIKDMRNLFRLKRKVKEIKDIELRNIKNLFEKEEEEENYYKPVTVNNFQSNGDKNNTNVMVTKIKYYQLKNILIKLNRI